MSNGFAPGTVVFDSTENEVLRVVASNLLTTVAVTLDGTTEVTTETDTLSVFNLPDAL